MKTYESRPKIFRNGTKIYNAIVSKKAKIGSNCIIGNYVEIGPGVIIGDNCKIEAYAFLPPGVEIGNNVFVGPRVTFTNDRQPQYGAQFTPQKTIVKDMVTICAGCVILPKITLEYGCFIGAGSVVTKDVPANKLVYGVPAKIISNKKKLFNKK
jgi:UDP-2-acetamido-3-amino-2,3-dideoxy-glucuronate N-acetyltransferase